MNGPEHYGEAERLIAKYREVRAGGEGWPPPPITPVELSEAQVHATLALAAATADGGVMRPEDRDDWDRATGRLEDPAEHTWHGNCAIGAPCRGSL